MLDGWLVAWNLSAMTMAMTPPTPSPYCPPSSVLAEICAGSNAAGFRNGLIQAIGRFDERGDGLDAGDIELARLRQQARERAESLKRILTYDLDGNFEVDRAEMERAVPSDFFANNGQRSSNADQHLRDLFFAYDADRDQTIERGEIFGAPLPLGNLETLESLRAALSADADGDGRLGEAELEALAERVFREIDSDKDGHVSESERNAEAVRLREARDSLPSRASSRLCALPPVPTAARLMLFSSYSGRRTDPADAGTIVTDVRIEDGSFPLYLILTSHLPTTWRLSGATDRVAQIVLSARSGTGRVSAASGVPAGRVVTFEDDCLGSASNAPALALLSAKVWQSAGRRPDLAATAYNPTAVSFPSGEISPPPASARQLWTPSDICAGDADVQMPPDFGSHGVQAHYSFVTEGARANDLEAFLRRVSDAGFSFVPLTINLNGHDTLVVPGRAALTSPEQVRREFRMACALRQGSRIFLVHARHNLTTEQNGPIRVR